MGAVVDDTLSDSWGIAAWADAVAGVRLLSFLEGLAYGWACGVVLFGREASA